MENGSNKKQNTAARALGKAGRIASRAAGAVSGIFGTLCRGISFLWRRYHFLVPPALLWRYIKEFSKRIAIGGAKPYASPSGSYDYNKWIELHEGKTVYEKLEYNPLISIIIPVYNIGSDYLSRCLDSILKQHYTNFEVCLADDCSTLPETKQTLEKYAAADKRIKVKYRSENGHISVASNDAISMASGEFIALADDDDELTEDALYLVAKALGENRNLDFIYSDEDKLDTRGKRCFPNFKPDWSPDTLLSMNYICHLSVIRKSLVDAVGGFRKGFEGAQDYDLFLRVTEKAAGIYHIPRVLYHWRMVKGSTSMTIDNKGYAVERGKRAVEEALARRGIKGRVEIDERSTYYKVIYENDPQPAVSIIIPARDQAKATEACLNSLFEKTTYKNFEVLLVNNNSEQQETFELFERYKSKYPNFRVIDANYEFNYSKLNNEAVALSAGEYVCLLNNDTEIIDGDWLTYMVGYAALGHVGTVGAKLLYPDKTVQHAGTVIGLGGVASHAYCGRADTDPGDYGRLCVPYNYAANTAACIVVSKAKYQSAGGLNEELKVAYNDVDFNLKLLEMGYFNVFVPMALLYHHESKSRGYDTTSSKYKRFREEEEYMYSKWDKYIKKDPFYNPNYSLKMWFAIDR